MELDFSPGRIVFDRELSNLDNLVIKFAKILDAQKAEYVIISGYVAILFGRSRNTEDVDMFIGEMAFGKFSDLWNALEKKGFECINAASAADAYNNYLKEKLAIRFAVKGTFIPNFELKFPKTKYNNYSMRHKIDVIVSGHKIVTSELEMQIAFKLSLGSEKDFEDARHLYNFFREYLNIGLLQRHISVLKVDKEAERILWHKP